MSSLTFFDTFSGIGGFRLGLERAGFNAMGFCEKDPHCIQLYEAFFDTRKEFKADDISSIEPKQLPERNVSILNQFIFAKTEIEENHRKSMEFGVNL
jgi:site-specific DNA-cytosine methylase